MPNEKVEGFKLSKEQISFTKNFKQMRKIQRVLMNDLQVRLSEADQVRNQLGEIEQVVGQMINQAPPPFLKKIEGQEEMTQ